MLSIAQIHLRPGAAMSHRQRCPPLRDVPHRRDHEPRHRDHTTSACRRCIVVFSIGICGPFFRSHFPVRIHHIRFSLWPQCPPVPTSAHQTPARWLLGRDLWAHPLLRAFQSPSPPAGAEARVSMSTGPSPSFLSHPVPAPSPAQPAWAAQSSPGITAGTAAGPGVAP